MSDKKVFINAVLELYQEKGVNFKMNEVAQKLKMSKRTIYEKYGNKEALMIMIVEDIFTRIEERLKSILSDDSLDVVEKLIMVACAHPDVKDVDYHIALAAKDDFPNAYKLFVTHIEDNWDTKRMLYNKAIEQGKFKDVEYKIFRNILLGTIKQSLEADPDNTDELLEQSVRQIVAGFIVS